VTESHPPTACENGNDWTRKRLGDACRSVGGGTPSRSQPKYWNGKIPWASVKDFKDDSILLSETQEHITQDGLENSPATLLPKDTPVLCTRMAVGRCALTTRPTAINQDLKALLLNDEFEVKFFIRLLRFHGPDLDRLSIGSTVRGITTSDLIALTLEYPSKPQQCRIAAVLDTVDKAIAKAEAFIAKLRQVRAGTVDEMLTKAKHRCDYAPLSSVAFRRFSSVDKLALPSEEPVRLCNYLDVYQNDYVTAEMKFMHATATPDEVTQFGLKVGDVLITKDSESPDDIGIPCVIDSTAPDLLCGYHLALIRPNQTRIDPTYLALQLAHNRLASYFGQQAVGSTRYGLSVAAIANAPVLLPPLEEQREAGKQIRLQDVQINQYEAELRKLTSIKSGLMTDLLTGRVHVPELIGLKS